MSERKVGIDFPKLTRSDRIFARFMEDVSKTRRLMTGNPFSSSSELPKSTSKKTMAQIRDWLNKQGLSSEISVGPNRVIVYYYTPRH